MKGAEYSGVFGSAVDAPSTPPNATWPSKRDSSSRATSLEFSPPSVRQCRQDSSPEMAQLSYHPNRVLGRNTNGTIAMTTQPSNESELQLYRVLQRANLLAYYDTFICQGGDDVQQLCEAGEEEFLEIMALVGMASKPLHVRRLQKALHEWVTNPALFQSPIIAPFPSGGNSPLCPVTGAANASSSRSSTTTLANNHQASASQSQSSPNNCPLIQPTYTGNMSTPSPNQFPNPMVMNEYNQPCSPISMNPVLLDRQIQRLADAAETLVKSLPPMDVKPLINGNKKRISKDIENIMSMPEEDPRRMEAIRKYAAIYGRFDCKRKPEKPLTLHEVSVNEAAAQICSKIPILLYRRDELFPLARQVVRDSGYQYSKGHSRSQSCSRLFESGDSNGDQQGGKRMRLVSSREEKNALSEEERKGRQDRLEGIVDQLKSLGNKQEELKSQIKDANDRQNFQAVSELQNELEIIADHQMQLVNEKAELEKQQRRAEKAKDSEKLDTEDTDSQFSMYSNESTPSLLQDSQQGSPGVPESLPNPPPVEVAVSKPTNKRNSSQPTSIPVNSNSNDSLDFTNKQLLNEALDEGLRVAKELGTALDENIDMRLFNKYTEALRNSGCFGNPAIPGPDTANNGHHHNSRPYKETAHRPRGRPPKVTERDMQNNFYEQIFSQAQIQQAQMLASYQTQLQVQAALAFGDFNLASGGNAFGPEATPNNNNNEKEPLHLTAVDFTMQLNEGKSFEANHEPSGEKGKDCVSETANGSEKDEVAQSLSALISMANSTANDAAIKHELNLPSVEFKIT